MNLARLSFLVKDWIPIVNLFRCLSENVELDESSADMVIISLIFGVFLVVHHDFQHVGLFRHINGEDLVPLWLFASAL